MFNCKHFKRNGFADLIQERFNRKKKNDSAIEDIYDGIAYKKLSENDGPLSSKHPYNVSFLLNTDGVPVFKSSKMSVWPIFLMVNELPYKQRIQSSNMLLVGLWFGNTKPIIDNFTRALHNELKSMEQLGTDVVINGHEHNCKAFLIGITADLPAKCTLLNMVQFNGAHSCCFCRQQGENYRTVTEGNVRIFPYNTEDPLGEKRRDKNVKDDALEAFEQKKSK